MKKTYITLVAAIAALPIFAEIKMGAPFTDGAVLQRGMKVPVWGKATPPAGKTARSVKVEFAGQSKTAEIGEGGAWKVMLDPMDASKESRTMKVAVLESGESVEIKDILVGEVWFASGQSNMECPIWGGGTRYRDMKGGLMTTMTYLPNIRYVKSPHKWSVEPVELSAKWCKFTPESLQLFHRENGGAGVGLSAVAFYYARELYLALDVPIGILDASWGGTNIDAWTPRSGYDGCDESIKDTAEYQVKSDWKAETDKKGPIGGAHQQPTVLYNGMVASFAPMAMRGFIWYQGCHNSGEWQRYCPKLHALYNGWSREFENPALKLYLVQLAPFNHNWIGICMSQNLFCAKEKNAALAVTADVGNFDDIHPNDKEIVAKRLVVHALKRDYGFAIPEDDSPVFKSASFKDGKATLTFDNVKDWYVYAPNRSRELPFELAGEDGDWKPAKVLNFRKQKGKDGTETDTDYIDGAEIVLYSEDVPEPVKARYMGRPRTSGTLYNEASLPLGPFAAQ
jgi:sialate O-acetylesterase